MHLEFPPSHRPNDARTGGKIASRLRPRFPISSKGAFAASLRPDLWISLGQREPLSRAERSEFIVSLDSSSRWLHRKYSGRRDAGLILSTVLRRAIFNHPLSTLRARFHEPPSHQFRWFGVETDAHFCRPPSSTPPFSAPPPVSPDCGSHVLVRASAPLQVAHLNRGANLAASISIVCRCLFRCFEIGLRWSIPAELCCALVRPQ